MSEIIGGILREPHAADKSHRKLLKIGCFFRFFKHALKFFARRLRRNLKAEGTCKLKKFFEIFLMRCLVNAIDEVLAALIDLYGNELVRFQHELFNELMSDV